MLPRSLNTVPVIFLLAIGAVFLAGCGLSKPSPVINTFDIDSPQNGPPAFNQVRPFILRVNQMGTAAAYEGRKLIYKTRQGRLVDDYYNELIAGPGRLLADSLAAYLDRRSPYFQVVRIQGEKGADFVLEGYLGEFLGDFSLNPPQARITVAMTLNDVRQNRVKIVLARTYQAIVDFSSNKEKPAPELVDALTKAWEQILKSADQDLTEYFRGQKKR
jgi:ABC-type uncharacterized transport system auxiliary subunit